MVFLSLHFNTSNVTIQQDMIYTLLLHLLISIHLMLLFNYYDGNGATGGQ